MSFPCPRCFCLLILNTSFPSLKNLSNVCLSFTVERENVQKRTFTRWINLHLEKVRVQRRLLKLCWPVFCQHNPPMEVAQRRLQTLPSRAIVYTPLFLWNEIHGCFSILFIFKMYLICILPSPYRLRVVNDIPNNVDDRSHFCMGITFSAFRSVQVKCPLL